MRSSSLTFDPNTKRPPSIEDERACALARGTTPVGRRHPQGWATHFARRGRQRSGDRKSTRLNSSHANISYAVFCLKHTPTTDIYTLSLHDALPICRKSL